jgi:hypothetical protein
MKIREQLKNITPIVIIAFAATTALLSAVVLLGIESGVDLDNFTQDPTAVMHAPFYLGFFSNIGIILWCSSAAFCFLSSAVVPSVKGEPWRPFFLSSGLITTLLMFDDFLLLHEEVFPVYAGISENSVLLVYINLIIIYLVFFWRLILRTEFILLGMAFACVGISKAVAFIPMPIPEDSFLEDAVKLFGIVAWFIYFTRLAYQEISLQKFPPHESENR